MASDRERGLAARGLADAPLMGKAMAERGIAVVIVTHNLPLAFSVSHRMVVLNRGRKVADVVTAETENDHIVGWITGARASQFTTA